MARKKKQYGYGTDIFDMTMALDNPDILSKRGKKKRLQWKRRGLI